MVNEKILESVKKARENAPKRNFKQSFDIHVNLKNTDLKKPENKVKTELALPHPVGKEVKIGVFADVLVPQVKKHADAFLISRDQIDSYAKDKKKSRDLGNNIHSFLAEAPLMPQIEKALGPVLAVRNKMPKPIPPTIQDLKPLIERAKNSVRISLKDSPVLNCRIGLEEMSDDKIADNAEAVINAVIAVLPKGREQFKNAYIKLTMGKPVKVEM